MTAVSPDDTYDAEADKTILDCLNLSAPKSFFLYAGAGSGKTRSLVEAIRTVCREQGRRLTLNGQQIGVITYTNAACDEIKQRLEFDPRVEVSTIHAFAWLLVRGYDNDIRRWLAANLLEEIAELEALQARGRASKASDERARSIESKRRRHASLDTIARFIYNPTGDNTTRDSLNHAEVIAMTAVFLATKPGLQRLMISRFPILLIDESQDTNGRLMDAFLSVQAANTNSFLLGLFGDTMQRIYADGKVGLADAIPADWARPRKAMNHRCPTRVIDLINKVRADDDGQTQRPRSDAPRGTIRLFLAPEGVANKAAFEASIAEKMAKITGDAAWSAGGDAIKTLALEHLMAARRFGFEAFFQPLYAFDQMRTGLLDGTGKGLGFFTREILPLATALVAGDKFATAAAVRRTSPLLDHEALEAAGDKQHELLNRAKEACDGLKALLLSENSPSLRTVLRYVAQTKLFAIPEVFTPFAAADDSEGGELGGNDEAGEAKSEISAWRQALEAPFEQIAKYDRYVQGVSQFDTHQGVKGLEFPRVMVVISDEEARGFMFSYDKLMGTKGKTKTDKENEATGKETSIDRTRRLFYVTCSRTEQSLAIVYYSSTPQAAQEALVALGWFAAEEIERLGE